MSLSKLLAHPLTRGMNIDAPQTTSLRRRIIRSKPFLTQLYQEWYQRLDATIPQGDGAVLELGSGAGFFKNVRPDVITSEVFHTMGIDAVLDAQNLPFANKSLKAIVMIDVLHHLPMAKHFLSEASRCLRKGGVVAMVEPWKTPWSSFVYKNLHHEPFDPDATKWAFPSSGPLSGANGALPWIIFSRDRDSWPRVAPLLDVESIEPDWPFSYLASGGVSMRSLSPGWSFPVYRFTERILSPLQSLLAMFALITIRKNRNK